MRPDVMSFVVFVNREKNRCQIHRGEKTRPWGLREAGFVY